jgi:hypothetical protein
MATLREAWISDGRQVLHFRPARWDRWLQTLEVTSGEWLPDQREPLLKRRQELPREQAIQLWRRLRRQGWVACGPQWRPPAAPADKAGGC